MRTELISSLLDFAAARMSLRIICGSLAGAASFPREDKPEDTVRALAEVGPHVFVSGGWKWSPQGFLYRSRFCIPGCAQSKRSCKSEAKRFGIGDVLRWIMKGETYVPMILELSPNLRDDRHLDTGIWTFGELCLQCDPYPSKELTKKLLKLNVRL